MVTHFAGGIGGNVTAPPVDGIGTNAFFRDIQGLTTDSLGNLYVSDVSVIRKVTPERMVTTLAGGHGSAFADGDGMAATFSYPAGIAVGPDGKIYLADVSNQRIRRITYSPVPTAAFNIGLYAGLSITGLIGRSYRIDFVNSLPNSDWKAATTIKLTSSPYLWFDAESIDIPKRFYRAVLLP